MVINMLVDLANATFQDDASLMKLAQAGIVLENRKGASAGDRQFIESTFGGSWAAEANDGWNWIARRNGAPVGFCSYEQRTHRWWWLSNWLERTDVGIFGPMGVDERSRGSGLGCALAHRALRSLQALGFAYAIIPAVGPVGFYERCCGARVIERLAGP